MTMIMGCLLQCAAPLVHNIIMMHVCVHVSTNNKYKKQLSKIGMAMPKSTQTRFLGIRDNHNHYTSLRLLYYEPMDVDLSKACYTWSILALPNSCYTVLYWSRILTSLSIMYSWLHVGRNLCSP